MPSPARAGGVAAQVPPGAAVGGAGKPAAGAAAAGVKSPLRKRAMSNVSRSSQSSAVAASGVSPTRPMPRATFQKPDASTAGGASGAGGSSSSTAPATVSSSAAAMPFRPQHGHVEMAPPMHDFLNGCMHQVGGFTVFPYLCVVCKKAPESLEEDEAWLAHDSSKQLRWCSEECLKRFPPEKFYNESVYGVYRAMLGQDTGRRIELAQGADSAAMAEYNSGGYELTIEESTEMADAMFEGRPVSAVL